MMGEVISKMQRPPGLPLLEEFPLGVISARPLGRETTRSYQAQHPEARKVGTVIRKLTVTAGEQDGLPNPEDFKVLLALLQLCKEQGWQKTFRAERYHIARIIGNAAHITWMHNGWLYNRIKLSLQRWRSTQYDFEEETLEEEGSARRHKSFQVLSSVQTKNDETMVTWHDVVFRAFQLMPWPALDISRALGIEGNIARQLYCFLEGRFQGTSVTDMFMAQLANEHLGLSKKASPRQLKSYVKQAITELEQRGYLKPLPILERFRKNETQQLRVFFEKTPP